MGLSRTFSEIGGDFSLKLQNPPPPYTLRPRWWVPLGIGYRRTGQKKTGIVGLSEGSKSFKISSAFRHNTCVWRTDGRTSFDGKDRAMQSVARVKKFERNRFVIGIVLPLSVFSNPWNVKAKIAQWKQTMCWNLIPPCFSYPVHDVMQLVSATGNDHRWVNSDEFSHELFCVFSLLNIFVL